VVTALNVNKGDLTVPGSVLASIARVERIKVIFNINEKDAPNFSIGQPVTVLIESNADVQVQGKIIQLSRSADIRSRSFEVKALFSNTPDRRFKPGLFAQVHVSLSGRLQTLVVPNAAIQSDGINNRVYIVQHGLSLQRQVDAGVSDETYTEILRGVNMGDTVITTGVTNVSDSSLVSIVSHGN
jgi:membrane fusion protein, multidrug efflux system